METYEGVGQRIRARLVVLGYAKPSGELEVQRFCFDHRFDKTNVYNWLGDINTPLKDLIRFCRALDCSAEWLLTGEERIPKAAPASGRLRRHTKNLVLALSVGAGALWPSGSAAPAADPLSAAAPTSFASAVRDYVKQQRLRRSLGIAYA